jgi:hypothetical protein
LECLAIKLFTWTRYAKWLKYTGQVAAALILLFDVLKVSTRTKQIKK